MRLIVLFAIFALVNSAHAEYRAFELAITNTKTNQVRKVVTTFDHIQYPDYHFVASDETVQIEATWMCWKRGDWMTPTCPNPYAVKNPPGPGSNSLPDSRSPASR